MGIKLDGDWNRLSSIMDVSVLDMMDTTMIRCGEIVRKNIIKGIQQQKIEGPPLKASTIEAKAKRGGSDKTLIDKRHYFSSFTVYEESKSKVHIGSNHKHFDMRIL